MLLDRLGVDLLVGLFAVLGVPIGGVLLRIVGIVPQRHDVVMIADEDIAILESQTFGVFLAPIIQRGADRLGRLESRYIVAAEATQTVDRLTADVPFEVVFGKRFAVV